MAAGLTTVLAAGWGAWSTLANPADLDLEYFEPTGVQPGSMHVYFHRPDAWRPDRDGLLVVLHGADRKARNMRDIWRATAIARNLLLIVPEFNERKYPDVADYNFGGAVDSGGGLAKSAGWSLNALDRAVDAVRARTGAAQDRYTLVGFSAGAQFAQRFLFLTGAPRSDHVVLSAAGWYTLPVLDRPWPCGLLGTGADEATLKSLFSKRVTLEVGLADTSTHGFFGVGNYGACAAEQGPNRLARGRFFHSFSQRQAQRLSTDFNWEFIEARGGHSPQDLARQAHKILGIHTPAVLLSVEESSGS